MKTSRELWNTLLGTGVTLCGADLVSMAVRGSASDILLNRSSSAKIDQNTIITFINTVPKAPDPHIHGTSVQMLIGVSSQFNDKVVFGGLAFLQKGITEQLGTVKVTLESAPMIGQSQIALHLVQPLPPELQQILVGLGTFTIIMGGYLAANGLWDLKGAIRESTKLKRIKELFTGRKAAQA